jgi:ubiquinone/menaquinone biosynthesis C-methylase UbiE
MTNKSFKNDLIEAYNKYAATRESQAIESWKLELRAEFLSLIKEENKASLLEIGAGAGKDSLFFQENGLHVKCIDLSPELVKICQQKGLDAQIMDMTELSFPKNSFDVVYALNSLLHIPKKDLPAVLKNIQTVLKPNGLFYMGVYGSEHESEHIWENDRYTPKRFFAFYSDKHLQEITGQYFEKISFKKITFEGDQPHFQRLILRKP